VRESAPRTKAKTEKLRCSALRAVEERATDRRKIKQVRAVSRYRVEIESFHRSQVFLRTKETNPRSDAGAVSAGSTEGADKEEVRSRE
jgi:hypothetical protein